MGRVIEQSPQEDTRMAVWRGNCSIPLLIREAIRTTMRSFRTLTRMPNNLKRLASVVKDLTMTLKDGQ